MMNIGAVERVKITTLVIDAAGYDTKFWGVRAITSDRC